LRTASWFEEETLEAETLKAETLKAETLKAETVKLNDLQNYNLKSMTPETKQKVQLALAALIAITAIRAGYIVY
jgi:hypothetical protein